MKKQKFVIIPSGGQLSELLHGKNGIDLVRVTSRGEMVVNMTPQRAGSLRRECPEVTVEEVLPMRPATPTSARNRGLLDVG